MTRTRTNGSRRNINNNIGCCTLSILFIWSQQLWTFYLSMTFLLAKITFIIINLNQTLSFFFVKRINKTNGGVESIHSLSMWCHFSKVYRLYKYFKWSLTSLVVLYFFNWIHIVWEVELFIQVRIFELLALMFLTILQS